jgi:peroxiredoxin (alkyl hydroperoxide reductase subunit C)
LRSEMAVLFFYPHDFSFICPTEVRGFNKAQPAFKAEHTSIVGVSIDDVETHLKWAVELGGLSYPLLADQNGRIAREYGVFDESEKAAMRATFILDSSRKIVYSVASAINVGRSVSETLRVVRALRCGRLCPADWQPGDSSGELELQR